MSDELIVELERALEAEGVQRVPDLNSVLSRGRRIRARRRFIVGFSLVSAAAAIVAALALMPIGIPEDTSNTDNAPVPPAETERTSRGEVVEAMTEQQEAEVFAFRALADTELMNPFGKRSYNFTYEEDTTRTSEGWRIGFAASDCEPRRGAEGSYSFTCRGISGENAKGNALTDTFVMVGLEDGRWHVTGVEGNMLVHERDRLVGYSLPREIEPSHWEFPAVGLWPTGSEDEVAVEMMALWVGPYPTSAPGSTCTLIVLDGDEEVVERRKLMYQEPPSRSFERGGWIHGTSVDASIGAERALVECNQYTGEGWEVASEPEIVGERGMVVAVTATLVWRGEEHITTPARCRATLVDGEGVVVWEGTGAVAALWRPGELKNYPYRAEAVITTRGQTVDAVSVGEFTCRSK